MSAQFLNDQVGHGMITIQNVQACDLIFAEPVIWPTPEEEEWQTPQGGNRLIGDRVENLGTTFTQNYLRLPNRYGELGKLAGVYKTHHLPVGRVGREARMLGCRLPYVNHSCVPNAALILKTRRIVSTPEGKATPGGITYAVVQALLPIGKGEEIEVSKVYGFGNTME